MSANKPRFSIAPQYQQAVDGMKFFSLKNRENSYVVPSTKNFIQDIQIRGLKIDQGATVSLFPIADIPTLEKIFSQFPPSDFMFSVAPLRTFGGMILALLIKPVAVNVTFKFNLYLGCDIYPVDAVVNLDQQFAETTRSLSSNPITSQSLHAFRPIAQLDFVHFFLSTEDINIILSSPVMLGYFDDPICEELLRSVANRVFPRRQNGLIGNDMLERLASVKYQRVEIFFDVSKHRLEASSWSAAGGFVHTILSRKYLRDNIDVDELNAIGPTDIWFEESEEFSVVEDEIEV